MSDAKNRCHAEETAACCCVDVGTVIDNQNCTASFEKNFLNQQEAKTMLIQLMAQARAVESEPCTIEHQIQPIAEGVKLIANFTFCCEAETLIFQLNLR
ncbi:YfcZ/YiiS family protein [Arsenophonus nasoniae]|nr:YfcZ/YiiS family protein [Arsenophonus nasoniae]QBY44114.1 hypothetical protein ArsFIN_26900 [Arsenophonus nasoniae]WGM04417.1 YfcZ/YiiS family protein [Arsenophonus nasoniae]WGM09521.1 YfcZ/YiiS family protein [Arsenophonus nasoniae]WGM14242.1 YfcZ/YiiS family protein [Arsenophonus nasoniae]